MERQVTLRGYSFSHTDLVRSIVIASLTVSVILITALALAKNAGDLYPQLFYFPILYATYFYPKRGIILSGLCGVIYECLVYFSLYPDVLALWSATAQAILFICIALAVAYFTNLIRVSEARYRSIFENSLLGIILFDKNRFTIRLANQQVATMLGYEAEELGGIAFSDLFFSQDFKRRFFEHLGSGEDIRNFETCFVTKDKRPHWVNLSWSRIDDTIVSCSITDIDAEKSARELAADSSIQYRQVTENSPTGMVITDRTTILFANPAFFSFSGYGQEECSGMNLADLVIPEDKDRFRSFSDRWGFVEPAPDRDEFRFLTKNGETRRAVLYFTPIIRNNRPAGLVNIIDNTEWEEYRERVEQTKERRREMMRAVAHELRTPLQPVLGYLNLLLQDPPAFGVTEETRQILERCAKSVDRERQIINQMLELSVLEEEESSLDYSVFPVAGMINNVISGGGYALKAEIAVDVPADLLFDADRQKLSYVIDVLVANGVAYSKPPRKIWITYRDSPSHPFHRLAIQDNGVGITEAQLDEIFKSDGGTGPAREGVGGTGLSLAIAKKYVQLHGGYISVDSMVNIGSTFTLHIPKKRPDGTELP